MGRSLVERKLRTDIGNRHRLRNELKKKQSHTARLTRKLGHTKKKRLNNRCSATIERFNAELEILSYKLYEMNADLQERIAHEIEFSKEEIQSSRVQYQKEYNEKAESVVEETSKEKSVSKEAMVARTKSMLGKERRIRSGIQKEIDLEEKDKVLFIRELQQITAELKTYGRELT